LIAIDRDPSVRPYFERFQRHAGVQARFLRGQFDIVLEQLASNGVRADAVLLDLGVSSMQLDRPERGFSYATDAPLDMRMDPSANRSAADLVNEADEKELTTIFRRYGEERYARQIARAIVRRRREQPFERTGDLVETIRAAIPAPAGQAERGRGGRESARRVGAAARGHQGALMATWSPTASTVAAPARRPRAKPAPAPRRRAAAQKRTLRAPIFWIVVLGILLA